MDNASPSQHAKLNDTPVWSSSIIMSLLHRMTETTVDELDNDLYAIKQGLSSSSSSVLLYPFQLFSLFSSSRETTIQNRSPSATRCQLLLSFLLSVDCATENPFILTLFRLS